MIEIVIECFNVIVKYFYRSFFFFDKLIFRVMKFDLKSNNFFII